jgi:hypothetical protein
VKSNYNTPLKIDHDGQRVLARGPLLWDTPEQRVRVRVVITQENAMAAGTSGDRQRNDDEWDYHAETNGTPFRVGIATAVGFVQVLEPGPVRELQPWTQIVVLEQD